jgi:hypothetical protein
LVLFLQKKNFFFLKKKEAQKTFFPFAVSALAHAPEPVSPRRTLCAGVDARSV